MKNVKVDSRAFTILSNERNSAFLKEYATVSDHSVKENCKILTVTEITTPYGLMAAVSDEVFLYFLQFKESDSFAQSLKRVLISFKEVIFCTQGTSCITQQLEKELALYFAGQLHTFTISYKIYGTLYQQKVWKALTTVSYAATLTYKEIASIIKNEKSVRAVGNANNKNPLALVIPCHRVIGTQGNLIGYAAGVEIKEKLLALEKNSVLLQENVNGKSFRI